MSCTRNNVVQFEAELRQARDLIALAAWIERARALTEEVSNLATMDKGFAERLRSADIRYNSALFEEHHSSGLAALLEAADSLLGCVHGGTS